MGAVYVCIYVFNDCQNIDKSPLGPALDFNPRHSISREMEF